MNEQTKPFSLGDPFIPYKMIESDIENEFLELPRLECKNCRHFVKTIETSFCNLSPNIKDIDEGPPEPWGACNTFYPNEETINRLVSFIHMNEWNIWSTEGHETPKIKNIEFEISERIEKESKTNETKPPDTSHIMQCHDPDC